MWRTFDDGAFARYYRGSCVVLSRSSQFERTPLDARVHILMHEAAHHKQSLEGAFCFASWKGLEAVFASVYTGGFYAMVKARSHIVRVVGGCGVALSVSGVVLLKPSRVRRLLRMHDEYDADRRALAIPCYYCARGACHISYPDQKQYGYVPQEILSRHAQSLDPCDMCPVHSYLFHLKMAQLLKRCGVYI